MSEKKYNCIYCQFRATKTDLVNHIDKTHMDEVPEGFTALQVVYHIVNKHPLNWKKPCRVCKKPTNWDEKKGRYNLLCENKSCHDAWAEKMKKDMGDKMGSNRPTSSAEGLQKMLAGRKISGKYKFKDGKEFTYTGSYELETLKFMDQVMDIKSEDILCPGPVLEYTLDEKKHLYITDIFYIPYNLIIEVKDGGNNPNTNPEMYENRRKKIAKEKYVIEETDYNYIRLTNKDFSQLLAVFADLKMNLVDNSNDRVIHINESAIKEGYVLDDKDIYYNKDKFDNGDINLCFIVGLSGSGKTTMANKMESEGCEIYQYDDLCMNEKFDDKQLKEYGDLFYSFFTGAGKSFRKDPNSNGKEYEANNGEFYYQLIKKFSDYAINYAKSHNNKKFVLEGLEPLGIVDLHKLDNCAVYIKGTSVIKSIFRSAKRDSSDNKGLKRILSFMSIAWGKASSKDEYNECEKILKQWREYFSNKEKSTVNENMYPAIQGAIPPNSANGVYIINYMRKGSFNDDTNIMVSDSPKFDRLFAIADDTLKELNKSSLTETVYDTYLYKNNRKRVLDFCTENINKPMTEAEFYKGIFGHEKLLEGQIEYENDCSRCRDFYDILKEENEAISKFIREGEINNDI